jgi:solute carrier family 25 (peroxisomal adenine nucleotide transporter), member 17
MKSNLLEPLQQAKLGGLASIVALAIWYPLDHIRTLLQTKKYGKSRELIFDEIRTSGLSGLYKGLSSGLLSMGISWFSYYYFYQFLQNVLRRQYNRPLKHVGHLFVGLIAGSITSIIVNPVWVLNTRMKLSGQGAVDEIKHMVRTEGCRVFYTGLGPSLLLVWNPALQFMTAEMLNDALWWRFSFVALKTVFSKEVEDFFVGGISKLVSTILTYPVQVLKTRMHASRWGNEMNVMQLIRSIVDEEGLSSFFHGIEAKLLQTVLTSATMFYLVALMKRLKVYECI